MASDKPVWHGLDGERLTPTQRIVRCACGWVTTAPRKNGAWMTLKKRLREHVEEERAKLPPLEHGVADEDGAVGDIEDD